MTGCEIVVVCKDEDGRTIIHAAKVRHDGQEFGEFIKEHPEALSIESELIRFYFAWRRANRPVEKLLDEILETPEEREYVLYSFDGEIPDDDEEAFYLLLEKAEEEHGLCSCSYCDNAWLVRDGVALPLGVEPDGEDDLDDTEVAALDEIANAYPCGGCLNCNKKL